MKKLTRDETEHGQHYYLASEVDALLAQPPLPVQPSVTRPCRSCDGTGDRDTGIPESPIATCKPCKGTGQIAIAAQPPLPVQEPHNFCPRCAKRLWGVLGQPQVHTCTPPLWGYK